MADKRCRIEELKAAIEREQSQTCLSYVEREQARCAASRIEKLKKNDTTSRKIKFSERILLQ